jgi:hypothetical protein
LVFDSKVATDKAISNSETFVSASCTHALMTWDLGALISKCKNFGYKNQKPCPSAAADAVDRPACARETNSIFVYIYRYTAYIVTHERLYIYLVHLGALTFSDAPPPIVVIDSFQDDTQSKQRILFSYIYIHMC